MSVEIGDLKVLEKGLWGLMIGSQTPVMDRVTALVAQLLPRDPRCLGLPELLPL